MLTRILHNSPQVCNFFDIITSPGNAPFSAPQRQHPSLATTADRLDNRSEGYSCVRSVAIPTANPVHPAR